MYNVGLTAMIQKLVLPIANGQCPMPDAAQAKTNKTKLCFKNGHCFNRRSNCQNGEQNCSKMVL